MAWNIWYSIRLYVVWLWRIFKKNERDRSIITENIPEYAIVGKPINFKFKINDENFTDKIKASFFLDGVKVLSNTFLPNLDHEIIYNYIMGKAYKNGLNEFQIFLSGELNYTYFRRFFCT